MKLSEQERLEAEKKLKNLSAEMNITQTIKTKAKEQTKRIQSILTQIKDSDQPAADKIKLLSKLTEQVLQSALKLEGADSLYSALDEKTRTQKERAVTERIKTVAEKEKYSEAIEDIKTTIAKIKKTVKDAQTEEDKKRANIETDLEKSLNEIREKIKTQDEEAIVTNEQTATLQAKIAEQRTKLEGLQGQYESKAYEKEDEVKKDKGDLLDKLKVLETQATEVSRLNTEFSVLEKKNFDNKLTIYIRQTKFPEYTGSFENTARVLSQCKDQLFKGVQRIKQLQTRKQKLLQVSQKHDKQFLALLGSQRELKEETEKAKKAKETVRTNILALQSEIKAKRETKAN